MPRLGSFTSSALLLAALLVAAASAQAQSAGGAPDSRVAENFTLADADTNGALSNSEFRAFMELQAEDGIGRSRQIVRFGRQDTAFGKLDADRDGEVTKTEFKNAFAAAN